MSNKNQTSVRKISWILNSTDRDGCYVWSCQIKHDRTKGLLSDLMGKVRQACCSCYWWYVTPEPRLSFINTSKEAVRSDTVNRKSRLMTTCLHRLTVCVLCVFSKQGKRWSSSEWGSIKMHPVVNANSFMAPYQKQVRTPRFSNWDTQTRVSQVPLVVRDCQSKNGRRQQMTQEEIKSRMASKTN